MIAARSVFAVAVAGARRVPLEAAVWAFGLVALAFVDPHAADGATLCPFHHAGAWLGAMLGAGPLVFCPGCGLGRSIAALWRADLALAWTLHPLGVPAVGVLGHRIATLLRSSRPAASSPCRAS